MMGLVKLRLPVYPRPPVDSSPGLTDLPVPLLPEPHIARERLDVRLGEMVLCTIVVDYVPNSLRSTLGKIQNALKTGEASPDAWAEVEIIPGDGFKWDAAAGLLRGRIDARAIPSGPNPKDDFDKLAATLLGRHPLPRKGPLKK